MDPNFLDSIPLPVFKVTVEDETFDIRGCLEIDRGCLIFRSHRGGILKVLASGYWSEVTQVENS